MPDGTQPTLEPNIEPIEIQEEMERSFLDYAMSVITARALPDARDGLKPVHRRILYGMYAGGLRPDRKHQKSAAAVGDVMGKFHPHGDQSIYDALARMAQDFSLRYPLIDGHGNFGTPDPNDRPAAMRYTEARLAPLAMQLLGEIDEDTVDFTPTYDGNSVEPVVLPARFPNLLVNGGGGIAVGMATNIPPHNLGEVIDAVQHLLEHPDASVTDLMQFVKGPDFPSGALILGRSGIHDAYTTGRGSIKMRAVAEIEEGRKGDMRIAVTQVSVPDLGRGDRPEDRGAGQRPQDRRHPRRAQRVVGRHHAPRRRAQARRQCAGRAEPPLQAHADADQLPGAHAGAGRQRAEAARPQDRARGLHRSPEGDHPAAHRVPSPQGEGARAHRRGPGEGARHDRRHHRPHPRFGRRRDRQGRPHGRAVRVHRRAGAAHPRHAAPPAHPARRQEAARRARRAAGHHRRAAVDPRQPGQARRGHQGRAGRGARQVRRRPAHRAHQRRRRPRRARPHRRRRGHRRAVEQGLHQDRRGRCVPSPGPWWTRRARRQPARRGLRRAPAHQHRALVPPVLLEPRQVVPAARARDPDEGAHRTRHRAR